MHANIDDIANTVGNELLDEDGFLRHTEHWSTDLANHLARHEGIERLSYDHWRVLHTIREYHSRFGAVPLMRRVCRENRIERQRVKQLFNSCQSAWRIAGLPHPGEEARAYMN
jgi:tRNA 2-thiouridine synthesizing protein E